MSERVQYRYSSPLQFLSFAVRLVILETLVPVALREVGDCLAWKGREAHPDREACRANRVPQGSLAAKVQL